VIRLFVDHLTVIDCSLLDAQRGLLGESWIVDLELSGALDEQGMIFDFAEVKKRIKAHIDQCVDHCLLVPCRSPRYTCDGDTRQLTYRSELGEITHSGPAQAVCELDTENITATAVEQHLMQLLQADMPANVSGFSLHLRHEDDVGAPRYQYSHGLKLHAGNCQRIAHGHRSRIEVWRSGKPAPDLGSQLAASLDGRYVGNRSDIVARPQHDGVRYVNFAYQAPSGEFRLSLPEERCYLIDTDSTAENIAQHLAATLHAQDSGNQYRVKAWEGVDKGAIGEA